MKSITNTVSQIAELAAAQLATGNTADYKAAVDLLELVGNGAFISYSATGEDGEPELRNNLVYKDSDGDWHQVLVVRHIGRACTNPSNDWEYTHWHDRYPVNDLAPAPATPAPAEAEAAVITPVIITPVVEPAPGEITNSSLVDPTSPIVNNQLYIINYVLLIIDSAFFIFLFSFLIINSEGTPRPCIRGPPTRYPATTGTSWHQ
jgi:hypothetical protein